MTDKNCYSQVRAATQEEAEKLARILLDARLARGVNVIPRIRSYYPLEGRHRIPPMSALLVVKSSPRVDRSIRRSPG